MSFPIKKKKLNSFDFFFGGWEGLAVDFLGGSAVILLLLVLCSLIRVGRST